MGRKRFLLALGAAKGTKKLLRMIGRNATYYPGKIALLICPDFIAHAQKPERVIAVTGTNGKTTVCNLLISVLKENGIEVMNNQMGSNVEAGIVASIAAGLDRHGKSRYNTAVFEVDERSSKRVYSKMAPDYLAITNLFRDSITRNAHPEYIANFISEAVPKGTKLILNGDDLMACGIAPENERVYYGIDRLDSDVTDCVNLINDMRSCPVCGGELIYDYRRYHHIGKAHCADCDYRSPDCEYLAENVNLTERKMTISESGQSHEYDLVSDSVFNAYNVVTLVSVLRELGLSHEAIKAGLDKSKIVASRYNEQTAGDIKIIMQMSKDKNALANSRVYDYVSSLPGDKELIIMTNCIEETPHWSENVCWMYDCDFEFLNNDSVTRIVAAGARAQDYYLRLLIAGIPPERIRCTNSELEAPELLEYRAGESVYVFYGTAGVALARRVQGKAKQLAEKAVPQ